MKTKPSLACPERLSPSCAQVGTNRTKIRQIDRRYGVYLLIFGSLFFGSPSLAYDRSLTVTSPSEACSSKKIPCEKTFIGVGSVHIHVAFQAISFCPDSTVRCPVFGHEVALST